MSSFLSWQERSFGEVATLQRGFDLPVQDRRKGNIPIFAANGPVGFHDVAKVKGPGVVTGRSGTLGKVHLSEGDYWPLNTALWVKDFHGNEPRWICRLLRWMNLEQFTRGVGVPTLNRNLVHEVKVRVPPLAEQKRIAGILDAADALRAKRRAALAQLDTLLQATFLHLFGDPVTNPKGWEMGVVGDLLESANYGTSEKAHEHSGKVPILRMNNITYSGEWDFKSLKYIDLNEKELAKYLVRKGQLLFNRTNSKELVGKTAVYRRDEPMAFAGYLVRGIVKPNADAEYIGSFMNTPQTKKYLQSKCKNIVGMANINAKEFQAIPMPKPPSELQRQFGLIVGSVEKQKAAHRLHLAELDTLFASLQSRAFRGEL